MFYLWRDRTTVQGCKQQGKRRGRELLERVVSVVWFGKRTGEPSGRLPVFTTSIAVLSAVPRRTFSPRAWGAHEGRQILSRQSTLRVSHGGRIFSLGPVYDIRLLLGSWLP